MGLVVVGCLLPAAAWHHLRGSWGTAALGVSGRSPGVLLIGCSLGWAAVAAIASSPLLGLLFLDEPEVHLLVVVQGRGRHEGLLQALSTSIAGIVVHYYNVVEIRKIISPM